MDRKAQLNKRFEMLTLEVEKIAPGLIRALKAGARTVLTDQTLGEDLTVEALAGIGGIVKVCENYEATVIFASWSRMLVWVKSPEQSLEK